RSLKPPDKGKGRNSRKPKLTVWSPDIQQAIKAKKQAFGEWKCNGQPSSKEHWLVINKKVTTKNLRKLLQNRKRTTTPVCQARHPGCQI
ncbi:MAG: hypothetical protein JAY74_10305, partial [Candidatus Thiodiazotropha taylori]|nr:hypothetical protein [Candidatus Thiodiazotropha taylori]